TANHYAVVQDLFVRLLERGYIFRQTMMGTYCPNCQRFLPDRYVEGTCPLCGYDDARGDQCDNCGKQLDPVDLVNPRCQICGHTPDLRETEHFFLTLPAFADRLRAWIENQDHWRINVRNFSLGLLTEGLQPRAITRDLEWGVPIPVEGLDDKRIYVWFDAVIGYLSASIEWARYIAGDPDAWKLWWDAELRPAARSYYFMGKDNIVFHTVIWPSILMGYNEDRRVPEPPLNLPYDVVSSEFLTMEGQKFSASRGVAVGLTDFLSRYDADPLRYFLMINGPEARDTDFTWAGFVRRNNDELVATWGNLVHRMLTFTFKHFGMVPPPGPLDEDDEALLAAAAAKFDEVGALLDMCRFQAAVKSVMALAHQANQYLDHKAPWATRKTDPVRTATTLYVILRVIDDLKVLLCPFLPHTCQRLHEYLGYDGTIAGPLFFREVTEPNDRTHQVLTCEPDTWVGRWAPSELPAGQALRQPEALFTKLEESVIEEELARMTAQVAAQIAEAG
ncbi:MAG: methionine--tRNA ligase, partial [Chloroflexi bacterium]|nr:methionine--tRNA ligase [Chloroflexota bacterium]